MQLEDLAEQTSRRVDVLGVGISAVSMDRAVTTVAGWIERGQREYVCATTVHGVMESQQDPELMRIHNDSGLTLPDGVPLVWSGRFAGAPEIERVYGPDFMLAVCELAAERGWSSFFYGGAPGVAELVARRLEDRFPGMRSAGQISPPYRRLSKTEDSEIVHRINSSGADLVWVGLGCPKQERWMAEHVDRLQPPVVLVGVGAAFDLHAGIRRDAPRAIRPLGLHWAYRLAQEPRRLWRRYLIHNSRFVGRIVRERPYLRPEGRARPADSGAGGDHVTSLKRDSH
jgi:N-acetylglucosaminyldiphosphoundecaprenol N-acetyl-beta-D-mannosaminyltransferase